MVAPMLYLLHLRSFRCLLGFAGPRTQTHLYPLRAPLVSGTRLLFPNRTAVAAHQQLQFDPTAPAPPAGGFVQTPLASFPMSPLLQTGVFASPAPTSTPAPAPAPQPSVWTAEQRAEFLRQQQVLHQLQHPSAQSITPVTSAPPTDSMVVTEPVATAIPATSAAPTIPVEQKSSSVDDDSTDDDADDSAAQFSTGPSLKTPPSPAQD